MPVIPENVLQQYINELWPRYDANNSGTLQPAEMHWLFNDLFARLGDPRRLNPGQVLSLFQAADRNHDGHVDRNEFLNLCRHQFQQRPYQGTVTVYQAPPANYQYAYWVQSPFYKVTTHPVVYTTTPVVHTTQVVYR